MKRIKYLVLMLIAFTSLNILAAAEFGLKGNETISFGETASYDIVLKSEKETIKELNAINIKTNNNSVKYSIKGASDCVYQDKKIVCDKEINSGDAVAKIILTAPKASRGEFMLTLEGTAQYGESFLSRINLSKKIKIVSNINTLDSIKINDEKLDAFKSNKYQYNLNVGSDIAEADINSVLTDTSASYLASYGNRKVDLKYGDNEIKIKVEAENGKVLEYTVNINRQDNRKTDSDLSAIIVGTEKIKNFKKSKYNYHYIVYKKDKVDISAETSDSKATYEVIGPDKLVEGTNEYQIVVKSEKGDSSTYNLTIENVHRKISKKLRSLSIIGYNLKFDKNNNLYKLEYKKEKMKDFKIVAVSEEDDKYVNINIKPDVNKNKNKIKPGKKIEIIVSGIDGEEEKYTIVFKRDSRLNFFFILMLIIILGLIIYIIRLVIKRKNKDDHEPKHSAKTNKKLMVKKSKEKKSEIKVPEASLDETLEIPVIDDDQKTKEITEDFLG